MCNKNLVFPAIIKNDGDAFMVSFPDLDGCFTDGETLVDAFLNAREALALYLHDLEDVPATSDIENIKVAEDERVMLVTPDEEDNIEYLEGINITEVLESALKKKGFTKYRVAKTLEISETYVNLIVSGKRVPSIPVAQKLGKLLGLDWRIFYPSVRV